MDGDKTVTATFAHGACAISGTVTVSGTGLAGVTMTGLPGDPVTDASGFYTAAVDYGSTVTVTPTHSYYTFEPSSQTYTNVAADITGQNYGRDPHCHAAAPGPDRSL